LVDDFLAAEEVGEFYDVVDVVAVLDVVGFVDHADVVEDIVLADDKLEKDDADGPDITLVGLLGVVQDGLEGHVGLCPYLVAPDYLQALRQSLVDLHCLLHLPHILLLLLHLRVLLLELGLEFGVYFSQSEVDDHSFLGLGVV
jgi:hypothetical protein